jgi:hypothetical protein
LTTGVTPSVSGSSSSSSGPSSSSRSLSSLSLSLSLPLSSLPFLPPQLLVFLYITPSPPEVRLQARRSKFLLSKIIHRVSDELEAASSGGLSSGVMIESEEKSKEARKQKRLEEQDRREYLVYSFNEQQGFYRQPPRGKEETTPLTGTETDTQPGSTKTETETNTWLGSTETVTIREETGAEGERGRPQEHKEKGVDTTRTKIRTGLATVSLRECVSSPEEESEEAEGQRRGLKFITTEEEEEDEEREERGGGALGGHERATSAGGEEDTEEEGGGEEHKRGGGRGRREGSQRDAGGEPLLPSTAVSSPRPPLPTSSLSALSKSQSMKAPRGGGLSPSPLLPPLSRKTPTRSVSLKTFGGKSGAGGGGESGGGVVRWDDGRGVVGSVRYNQSILRIESYNEREREDEERMLEEDESLMAVSNE